MTPAFAQYPIRPVRSLLFVPLKRGKLVIGVFLIANTDKIAAFDQNDLALLNRFSTLVSIALENARLLEHSKESIKTAISRADQLEALHLLSLEVVRENNPSLVIQRALQLAINLVEAHGGGYSRLQKPEQQEPFIEVIIGSENLRHYIGTKITLDQPSIMVEVIKTGQATLVDDYSDSIYRNPHFADPWFSMIAVPLWHKDQIDGVFTLISTEKSYLFNANGSECF